MRRESIGRIVSLVPGSTRRPGRPGSVLAAPSSARDVAQSSADPDAAQSALTGHYAWPVLPWIFIAAAAGAAWMGSVGGA